MVLLRQSIIKFTTTTTTTTTDNREMGSRVWSKCFERSSVVVGRMQQDNRKNVTY